MIDSGLNIINSVIGGGIMALATSAHLYLQGKITGIGGILFRCIKLVDYNYNYSFIVGMIFMSSYIKCFNDPLKNKGHTNFLESSNDYTKDLSIIGFIVSGFLVGFGARMGNGCTTGHGICGIPRFSKRSVVAIGLFMIFGLIVATFRYYCPFFVPGSFSINAINLFLVNLSVFLGSIAGAGYLLFDSYKTGSPDTVRDTGISFAIGAIFSYGLFESGMLQRHIVLRFLTLGFVWNWRLIFVLGSCIGFNIVTFNYILKSGSKPLLKSKFDLPTNTAVDNKLMVGASIFGIGWGISGVCPGPAILTSFIYFPHSILLLAAMCGGIYVESMFDKQITDAINGNAILSKINIFNNLKIKKFK